MAIEEASRKEAQVAEETKKAKGDKNTEARKRRRGESTSPPTPGIFDCSLVANNSPSISTPRDRKTCGYGGK